MGQAVTIRDLLVHVDHTPASDGRLAAALALAAGLGAHVTALYLIAEPFMRAMPSGMAGLHLPDGLIRQHLAGVEQEANAILAAAQEAAARLNVALDPCRQTGRLDRLPTLLACHARHADLTVVGQPDLEVGGVDDTLLVEAAFMDTGRPALVVPSSWIGALPPRRAIIAWDGSREAARAVHDLAITHISDQRRVGYSYGFDLCLSPTRSLEVEGLQMAQHRRTPS